MIRVRIVNKAKDGDAMKIQEQRDKIRKYLTNYYVCSSEGKVLEN